jgi:hypothetical protein
VRRDRVGWAVTGSATAAGRVTVRAAWAGVVGLSLGACLSDGLPGAGMAADDPQVDASGRSGIMFQGPMLQGAALYEERQVGENIVTAVVAELEALAVPGVRVSGGALHGVEEGPWLAATAYLGDRAERPVEVQLTTWTAPAERNRFAQPVYEPPPPDPSVPNSDIALYVVQHRQLLADGGERSHFVCPLDLRTGHHTALVLHGRWTSRTVGRHIDRAGYEADGAAFTVACTVGAVAKCALWGYKPWAAARAADGTFRRLGAFHRACVRAARADHCGDGTAHTSMGRRIHMYDTAGFIPAGAEVDAAEFSPESSYDEHGAGCLLRGSALEQLACASRGAPHAGPELFEDGAGRQRCLQTMAERGAPQLMIVDATGRGGALPWSVRGF